MPRNKTQNPNRLKLVSGIASAGVVIILIVYQFTPVNNMLMIYRAWIDSLGLFGPIIFVAIFTFAVTFMVPGVLLTSISGLTFGMWGFPLALIGAVLGAAISFLAGRFLVREWIQTKIASNVYLKAIDAAIGEAGWKVVFLLRLTPAPPFGVKNWLLGATSVSFTSYLLATIFGIMPTTALYTWIGTISGRFVSNPSEIASAKYALLGLGFPATVLVIFIVARKSRAILASYRVIERE